MSTFIDYQYQVQGAKIKIDKAIKAIKAFQADNAQYSGNGNCDFNYAPKFQANGSLSWGCYSTGGMSDLDDVLVSLTGGGEATLRIYQGCTDGTNDGRLLIVADGAIKDKLAFDADIGMDAAVGSMVLAMRADPTAIQDLIKRYLTATKDGWSVDVEDDGDEDDDDEDDFTHLQTAGVVAGLIGQALGKHPCLLSSAKLEKSLLKIRKPLHVTRKWITKFGVCNSSTKQDIDRLIALVERMELDKSAKGPGRKPIKVSKTREATRQTPGDGHTTCRL